MSSNKELKTEKKDEKSTTATSTSTDKKDDNTSNSGGTQTDNKDVNVWQNLLQKATRKNHSVNATLIVLGDKRNGKSSILSKFSERVSSATTSSSSSSSSSSASASSSSLLPQAITQEYILDYSYQQVKNKQNADKDEVLAHLNIWQLDDPTHADLLLHFVKSTALENVAFMATVNLSEPWNVLKSLTRWLDMLTSVVEKLFSTITQQEQEKLKLRMSRYLQFYVDPSVKQPELASEDEKAKVQVDTTIPKINLGFPIIIVGCKADYLQRKGSGLDDKFEYLTRRLRKICLDYGATLLYSSAVGKGVNVELLQDYILHRVYNFNLTHPAKAVGSTSEDDYNIYIPSGYDSLDLISSVTPGNSPWNDKTELETIFEIPSSQSKAKSTGQEIEAEDNTMFFRKLQFDLDKPGMSIKQTNGQPRKPPANNPEPNTFPLSPQTSPLNNKAEVIRNLTTPTTTAPGSQSPANNVPSNPSTSGGRGAGRGRHQTAVKAFFKSLLSNGSAPSTSTSSKENLRADAARALQTMSPTKKDGEGDSGLANGDKKDGQDQNQPNS